jgi:DNA-3-methyladenine glycosylase II
MTIASKSELEKAAKYLAVADPVLVPIIKSAGLATLTAHKNYYGALVNSIISQQLSLKAADAIEKRFLALFDGKFPTPQQIQTVSADKLRAIGFSYMKANYVHDLARHIINGKLKFEKFDKLSNHEIIAELTDVKGIGEWTAHMFLMFCMGRLDVLPVGDLGIRNGVTKLYGLKKAATPEKVIQIAKKNKWAPYQSVASWYIWHSLDNKPVI